jgi:ABC-type sugar transport system ATPase subunit
MIKAGRLRERAAEHVQRLGIKTPSVHQEVGMLSGGNQQKVVFAKWLEAEPSVLLLDDPTRGIDVGAKAEIYNLMGKLSDQGAVQVVASSDPRELAAICDEVVVFYDGRICARLSGRHLDAHTILEVMNTGIDPAGVQPPGAPGPGEPAARTADGAMAPGGLTPRPARPSDTRRLAGPETESIA